MNQALVRAFQAVRATQPCSKMSTYRNIKELTLNRPPPKMPKGYEKIIRKREIFQADNGLDVYIKGGVMDVILYRTTWFIVVAGNIYFLYQIPELIK